MGKISKTDKIVIKRLKKIERLKSKKLLHKFPAKIYGLGKEFIAC